jgi:hypothetical protein
VLFLSQNTARTVFKDLQGILAEKWSRMYEKYRKIVYLIQSYTAVTLITTQDLIIFLFNLALCLAVRQR